MKLFGYILTFGILLVSSSNSFAASDNGLITQLAKDAKISEDQAQAQVDAVFNALRVELLAGRDVTIKSFGRFAVQERGPRTGRNPRTGEAIEIGARRYPHFTSSDKLKETFNTEPTKKMASAAPVAASSEAPLVAQAETPAVAKAAKGKKK